MDSSHYIFVYGTLKRDTHSEMHQYLAQHADFIDDASYCGRLYQIDDYPGTIPSDDPRDSVTGEVYLIRHAEAVFLTLDRYEECGVEFSEPHEYCRKQQKVSLNCGTTLFAWIYLYNRATEGLQRLPVHF